MTSNPTLRALWIALALAVATYVLYLPTSHFAWLNVGDDVRVTDNSHVYSGITVANVRWALIHTHAGNWHPITWISHMLDSSLWGENASKPHRLNAALHALNTALLFVLLYAMTGATWRCALVAALFGWHPLNVESVAWISQRKDVLGVFFWLLTTLAYVLHARRPSIFRIMLVTLFFALGVMTNPLLAMLPFTLLLLDTWPLRRLRAASPAYEENEDDFPRSTPRKIILEKLPLFALAGAAAVMVFLALRHDDWLINPWQASLALRLENAPIACLTYLAGTFYPANLFAFYPWPATIPLWKTALALAILCGITAGAILQRRQRPWLIVGWLWYLVTLVPVVLLAQAGRQSMADHYAYVPLVGVFLCVAWSLGE
ncbi:MAG: tetratricopeptide repeat protein, partial [Chthoniobacterales bacterium]